VLIWKKSLNKHKLKSLENTVPTVRRSQRKSEKIKGSGKVREFESTRVQKLTKMQKKF